jgi:hypothetical protein
MIHINSVQLYHNKLFKKDFKGTLKMEEQLGRLRPKKSRGQSKDGFCYARSRETDLIYCLYREIDKRKQFLFRVYLL